MGLKISDATLLPVVLGTEELPVNSGGLDYKIVGGNIATLADGEYWPSGAAVFLYAQIYSIEYDNDRIHMLRATANVPGTARDMILVYNADENVYQRNVYGDPNWIYVQQTIYYNAAGTVTSLSDWVGIT